jgi:uncharacterized Tic20 family protein
MAKKKTPEASESSPDSEKTGQEAQAQEAVSAEQPEVSKNAANMAMLCHLLAIFTGFIGPLIIWLVKKDDDPFVDDQGKEALNFQITVLIAMIVSGLLIFVCIGSILMPAVWIVDLVFCIIASIKASGGQAYRYPLSIRFVK